MAKQRGVKRYIPGEWRDGGEAVRNKNRERVFGGWGVTTLANIISEAADQDYENAHSLWLKLKEAFNKEAKHYDPETNSSRLGSIGDKSEREVMRSMWWQKLDGDKYGDYEIITRIIELLHGGEQLETGVIVFGS